MEQLQCIQEVQPEEPEGLNSRYGRKVFHAFNMSRDSVANLPETMDWRTSGAVTAVKDQVYNYNYVQLHLYDNSKTINYTVA